MVDIKSLKVIYDTLCDLSSEVDELIKKESSDLLPEVAKFIEEHDYEKDGILMIGDEVITDTGHFAIVANYNYDMKGFDFCCRYDLLFDDGLIVEGEERKNIKPTGRNFKREFDKFLSMIGETDGEE